MSPNLKKTVAWILIVLLAIIAGVSEGLHWIPGCGHGVFVGDQILLLGIEAPDAHWPADARIRVERPRSKSIPFYDEDECAICSAVGHVFKSADSVPMTMAAPLVDNLPLFTFCLLPGTRGYSFQARAPPLA
ncbi:MAG: hypothetical protein JXB10_02290 [Pirellulales bacterium]|nr:hypothetical protein [Pirellulales bacterium]